MYDTVFLLYWVYLVTGPTRGMEPVAAYGGDYASLMFNAMGKGLHPRADVDAYAEHEGMCKLG